MVALTVMVWFTVKVAYGAYDLCIGNCRGMVDSAVSKAVVCAFESHQLHWLLFPPTLDGTSVSPGSHGRVSSRLLSSF